MAITIPQNLIGNPNITKGEKKIFEYLKENLKDDYLVYYNISIDGLYPDFIILGADLGFFVLEVKDWDFKHIKLIKKDEMVLNINGEEKIVKNPVVQARNYALKILNLIEKRCYIKGKKEFKLNWGYGVFLSGVKRKELDYLAFLNPDVYEAFGSDFIFTSDDLTEKNLIEKIKSKMQKRYGEILLSKNDIDFVRATIYPELLISEAFDDKNVLKVIDEKQEQIAKNLELGHYLIRGVAGSGKTIILIARAKFLSQLYPDWNILFLCYNKSLALYLKEKLSDFKNVQVMTYHSWCLKQLKSTGFIFDEENFSDKDFEELLPQEVIKAYSKNLLKEKYQAILVDEGQDFADLWYKSIVAALDKNTNSLLIALDSSQTIYRRNVSWKSLNIEIVGRTKILRKNYRNTKQILEAAYKVIREMDEKKEFVFEKDADYIVPESAIREGNKPELKKFDSENEEKNFLRKWIEEKLKENEEIMVLCPTRNDLQNLLEYLNSCGIKSDYISERKKDTKVVLSTIHSSKGLEADKVFIFETQKIEQIYKEEAPRLLYIAMTRSRNELCLGYTKDCKIIKID